MNLLKASFIFNSQLFTVTYVKDNINSASDYYANEIWFGNWDSNYSARRRELYCSSQLLSRLLSHFIDFLFKQHTDIQRRHYSTSKPSLIKSDLVKTC